MGTTTAPLTGDEKNVVGYLQLAGAAKVSDFTWRPTRLALLGLETRGLVAKCPDGLFRLTQAGKHVTAVAL
jgi:hypothetical protein